MNTKNLEVHIKDSIDILKNKEINIDEIKPEIVYKENLLAPISKGDVIGNIKYNVDGIEYDSKLTAASDVEQSYLWIYILIVGLIFAIFILFVRPKRKKKARRKRRK